MVTVVYMAVRHCRANRQLDYNGEPEYVRAHFLLSKEHDKKQLVLSLAAVLLIFSAVQLFEKTTYSGGFLLVSTSTFTWMILKYG